MNPAEAISTERDEQTAGRIRAITQVCDRAAQGDLEARITGMGGDPEWQPLASAINRMLDLADSFVRESAAAMDHCSRDLYYRPVLLRGLKGAYRQSSAVINQAGRKMKDSSEQIHYVARMAAETAANVSTVAAACEELSSTSNEISQQAGGSARLSEEAVAVTRQASLAVSELTGAARKVDNIVKLINTIAGQTNLLALNATIEAARAGEAGKGFAVVANEVKELAKETAKATDDISKKIEAIQQDTKGAVKAIGEITAVINRINDLQTAIAGAVEEQTATTNEIGRNVGQAATGSGEIARNVSGVAEAARSTAQGASATLEAASALARLASELQHVVGRFKLADGSTSLGGGRGAISNGNGMASMYRT